MDTPKKYNESLAGFYHTSKGNLRCFVTERNLESMRKSVESLKPGDILLVKYVKEKKAESHPDAWLEVMNPMSEAPKPTEEESGL